MSYQNKLKQFIGRLSNNAKPEEVIKTVQDVIHWINFELPKEFTALQNSGTASTQVFSVSRTSGGGSSSISTNLVAGSIAVGTSATLVGYSSITNPIVLYRCVNANNESVGCDLSSITSSNFSATALESATLYYAVLGS